MSLYGTDPYVLPPAEAPSPRLFELPFMYKRRLDRWQTERAVERARLTAAFIADLDRRYGRDVA